MFFRNAISGCFNTLSQWGKQLVPIGVNCAINAGFKNPRMGQIVAGTLMAASGLYLTARTFDSWLWQRRNQAAGRGNFISKTLSLALPAALGVCLISAGIANIVIGVNEMMPSSSSHYFSSARESQEPLEASETTTEDRYFTAQEPLNVSETTMSRDDCLLLSESNMSASVTVTIPSCEDRLALAREKLLSCPDAAEFWDRVEGEGPFSMRCGITNSGAYVDIRNREITVERSQSNIDAMGNSLFFELNNLAQSRNFTQIEDQMCETDPDTFANEIENLEMRSAHRFHEISDRCERGGYWNWQVYQNVIPRTDLQNGEADQACEELHENNGHTEFYRDIWRKICAPQEPPPQLNEDLVLEPLKVFVIPNSEINL